MTLSPENSLLPSPAMRGASAMLIVLKGRGPNNWVNTRLASLDRVTLADVRAVARERLVPTNRVILVYVPNRAPATQTPRAQP